MTLHSGKDSSGFLVSGRHWSDIVSAFTDPVEYLMLDHNQVLVRVGEGEDDTYGFNCNADMDKDGIADPPNKVHLEFNGIATTPVSLDNAWPAAQMLWGYRYGNSPGAKFGTQPNRSWQFSAARADFNQDRNLDAIKRSATSAMKIDYLGADPDEDTDPGSSPNWEVLGCGDINRDGRTDLLFEGVDPDHWLAVWYMKQNKKVESLFLDPEWIADSYKIAGVADFNGDSKLDVLFQNANGLAVLWYMDGPLQTGSAPLSPQPLSSERIVGTGDFDHDGKTDILFQVNHPPPPDWSDHRALFVWFMDGPIRKQNSPVLFLNPLRPSDAAWTYSATGDFNNDGYSDILFQRRETAADGTQLIRLMYWYLTDYPGTTYGVQVQLEDVGEDQERQPWGGFDIVGPR